jgi:prolyl-tRNA synthetase
MILKIEEISTALKFKGIRTYIDDRENVSSGFKYNHWEIKGVPIRIELGPNDYKNKQVRVVKRNDGKKINISWEAVVSEIPHILEQI